MTMNASTDGDASEAIPEASRQAVADVSTALETAVADSRIDEIANNLHTVVMLAEESKALQESLGSHGVCHIVVNVLQHWGDNASLCEYALLAAARLCKREQDQHFTACVSNISRLTDLGACLRINEALHLHVHHIGVVEAAFHAITSIASITQQSKDGIRQTGACENVVLALKTHVRDPDIAEQACWVITFLACDHPNNKVLLQSAGACAAVAEAITIHMNSTFVLARAFGAVAFMSKGNEANRAAFVQLRVCELAVESLHKYPEHKGLAQTVCHVLLYLYYHCNPDRIAELTSRGALDSRGWVVDMSYAKLLAAWRPDDVLEDISGAQQKSNGLCAFLICL